MKTNRWMKWFLASMTILCLAVICFDVKPAQAGPPAAGKYVADVELFLMSSGPFCTDSKYTFYGSFEIKDLADEADGIFGAAQVVHATTLGKANLYSGCTGSAIDCNTPGGDFPKVYFYMINTFELKYTTPGTPGLEHLSVAVYDAAGNLLGRTFVEFKVISCIYSFRGSADVGATANAMSPGSFWNFVGSYDIVGTLEKHEDGTLIGQGTTNLFMDATGSNPLVACDAVTPWQGSTAVELKADPTAWSTEGVLDIQAHLEPMPINFTGIKCKSFGVEGYGASPAITIASFDLDFAPLPGDGGSTSLEFQIPGQPGEFKMDLIVSPQEAGS